MVEQDTVDGEHAVRLAVLLHHPEAVLLGDSVRGIGVEGRRLALGNLLDLAIQLRGGSLIDPAGLGKAADAHRFQHAQHAQRVHVAGVFGRVEGHLHVALRGEVVDFVGPDLAHQTDEPGGIGQVAVVQMDGVPGNQVVDAGCVGDGRTADDAVNLVALFQQKLCQIRAVLTGDAGNQRSF